MFQSLQFSWQTARYTSDTIATRSTKAMFTFSSFTSSWHLSPMTSSQKFQLDPPFSTGKYVKVVPGIAADYRPTKKSLKFAILPAALGSKSPIIHVSYNNRLISSTVSRLIIMRIQFRASDFGLVAKINHSCKIETCFRCVRRWCSRHSFFWSCDSAV